MASPDAAPESLVLPGFGLPPDDMPPVVFPHAIDEKTLSLGVTLRERRMME